MSHYWPVLHARVIFDYNATSNNETLPSAITFTLASLQARNMCDTVTCLCGRIMICTKWRRVTVGPLPMRNELAGGNGIRNDKLSKTNKEREKLKYGRR